MSVAKATAKDTPPLHTEIPAQREGNPLRELQTAVDRYILALGSPLVHVQVQDNQLVIFKGEPRYEVVAELGDRDGRPVILIKREGKEPHPVYIEGRRWVSNAAKYLAIAYFMEGINRIWEVQCHLDREG